MSKKIFEHIRQEVDYNTGEIKEESRSFVQKVDKQKFMIVYLDTIKSILKVKTPVEYKILLSLWVKAEYETNKVYLVKDDKEELANELDYGYKTIENAISRLVKKKLLIRKATGVYYLNPTFFFKGSEIARANTMKFILSFDMREEEVPTEIEMASTEI